MPTPLQIPLNVSGRSMYGQLYVIVDQSDYEDLVRHNWSVLKDPRRRTFYARRSVRRPDGKNESILMHRLLLPGAEQVDHINGNGLDNRRANLRAATHSQNQHNRGLQVNNTSGYIGVGWDAKLGKWRASIAADGKRRYLGLYLTAEDAARARDRAAIELRGAFACLNFPRTTDSDGRLQHGGSRCHTNALGTVRPQGC